jgi:superfamily II DNA or RNA helicase
MHTDDDIVCIATYPIFQQGVNIPSLRTIILSSSTKSFIRVIQSLGRILRKHVSKDLGGAELFDICDNVRYLKDHAGKRERHFVKEKHNIEVIELNEKDGIYQI